MEFLKIWEILVRRKWIIIGTFLVFVLTTFICVKIINKTYQAKAKVLVESSDTSSTVLQALGLSSTKSSSSSSSSSSSTDPYATDIALAMVRPVLDNVISRLHLVDRNGTTIDPDDFANLGLSKRVKYKLLPQPYIEVEQYSDSSCDILEISAYSTSAAQAADIANTLVASYIEDRTRRTRDEYKGARLYIQSQIQNVKKDYNQSLAAYRDFKVKEKTIDLTLESQNAVNMVQTLMLKNNDLMVSIADKSVDYTHDHPEILKLKNDVEAVNKLLGTSLKAVDPLAAKLAGISQIELLLAVNKDIYQKLLAYLTQVEIAESITLSNIKLVEPAVVPTKVFFPVKLLGYALGSFLGFFWGIALAFFIEYIDNTIKTPDDIKKHFKNVPLLGSIPKSKVLSENTLISELSPTVPIVEVFRTIKNSILFASVDKPIKTLMVTSAQEDEGKSTFAANIGIAFRDATKKIIIVDLDLRKPTLHKKFKLHQNRGIINLVMESAQLDDVIVQSGIEGIDLLPSGPVPEDPTKLVESRKIQGILTALIQRYDLVIIDTPPILAVNDALIIGRLADATVMVMGAGAVSFSAFEHTKDQLDRAGIDLVGIILNKFRTQGSIYYYYHYYGKYGSSS